MIVIFGRKGCSKTIAERKVFEGLGRQIKYFDIDTRDGKEEMRKRGLFYKEVKKNTPWVINE